MRKLRTNTARTFSIGPFVLDTDGKTPQTGLTIAASDIKLIKNGAASVNSSATGRTHLVNGMYTVTLPATDLNFLGDLMISVKVTNALSVWHEFSVLNAGAYDFKFGADNTAALKIKSLAIVNDSGDAIYIKATNAGIVSQHGINIIADRGNAINCTSSDGIALNLDGKKGPALRAVSDGYHGVVVEGWGSGCRGIDIMSQSSDGIRIDAGDAGHALALIGGNFANQPYTGNAINCIGSKGVNAVEIDTLLADVTTIKGYTDTLETELAKVVGKLPATGLISAQNDVVAIQNNTSFVTTLPDTAMIPTVIFPFKVNCFTYDTAGNMEDTDSGLYMKLETSYGVSRNDRMFSDTAMGTNLTLVTTGQFAGYVRFIPVDQGSWTGYYKASPTDDAELLVGTFKYIEGGVMKTYGRSIMLTKQNVGDVNIAATDANMGVIAKAIRGYDSSLMGLNPLSIEGRNWKDHVDIATAVSDVHQQTIFLSTQHDAIILQNGVTITDLNHIMPEIDHISTTVDDIHGDVGAVKAVVDNIHTDLEVAKIVLDTVLSDVGKTLKTDTAIDGLTTVQILELCSAMVNGKFEENVPAKTITFYKRDNVTELFTVQVTDIKRERV